jgi:hypothetical protein
VRRRQDCVDARQWLNRALTLSRNDAISCEYAPLVRPSHRLAPCGKTGRRAFAICPLDLLFAPSEPPDGRKGCANPPPKQASGNPVPFRERAEDTIFSDTYRRKLAGVRAGRKIDAEDAAKNG